LVSESTFNLQADRQQIEEAIDRAGDPLVRQQHSGVILNIAAGGSVVGIQAIHDGAVDIGRASRALKTEEAAAIHQHQIAVDVIAVVVPDTNPVAGLSMEQLRRRELAGGWWSRPEHHRRHPQPELGHTGCI
jgi:hypothetical protein